MNASELQPVVQFLQGLVPFDALPKDVVVRCAKAVTVGYYSKASGYVHFDANSPKLYMVRSGAFEVRDPDDILHQCLVPFTSLNGSGEEALALLSV